MPSICAEDPGTPDAIALTDELSAALAAITGDSGRSSFDPDDVRVPRARFAVARNADGQPIGCGAFRPLGEGVAEIKRMYARAGNPGTGRALLAFLESEATALGYRALWLETRIANQRAVSFYSARGYTLIPNYGRYAGRADAVCLAKQLATPAGVSADNRTRPHP
ncbi:MAG: GNAT family N-acetyltransferase [Telluria sp.]